MDDPAPPIAAPGVVARVASAGGRAAPQSSTAGHFGRPGAAGTGCVDFVPPPGEIAHRLVAPVAAGVAP